MRKKKTAKETVAEIIAKVDEELLTPPVTTEAPKVEAPKTEEAKSTHYYRCNVELNNGKACNCSAFM